MKRSASPNSARSVIARLSQPSVTFVDVWESVAKSHWLTTPELGRLLLLTWNIPDKEAVWEMLCTNRWESSRKVKALRAATKLSPKDLFRAFGYRRPKPPIAVPPLKYSPDDYVFIVDIRDKENKVAICEAIEGATVPEFFEKGITRMLEVESPVEFPPRERELRLDFQGVYSTTIKILGDFEWNGTVHLIRRPDRKAIKILDFQWCKEEVRELDCEDCSRKGVPEGSYGGLPSCTRRYESTMSSFTKSPLFTLIKDYYEESDDDEESDIELLGELQLDYRHVEDKGKPHLCIHGFKVLVRLESPDSSSLDVYSDFYFGEKLEDANIQFSHILESLDEWRVYAM